MLFTPGMCRECVDSLAALAHTIPLMMMMHLALLQEMVMAVASYNQVAYEVKKKMYQEAAIYQRYFERFQFQGAISLEPQPPTYKARNYDQNLPNMAEIASKKRRSTLSGHIYLFGFGKRGLLEKGSLQKSPCSRDSR